MSCVLVQSILLDSVVLFLSLLLEEAWSGNCWDIQLWMQKHQTTCTMLTTGKHWLELQWIFRWCSKIASETGRVCLAHTPVSLMSKTKHTLEKHPVHEYGLIIINDIFNAKIIRHRHYSVYCIFHIISGPKLLLKANISFGDSTCKQRSLDRVSTSHNKKHNTQLPWSSRRRPWAALARVWRPSHQPPATSQTRPRQNCGSVETTKNFQSWGK